MPELFYGEIRVQICEPCEIMIDREVRARPQGPVFDFCDTCHARMLAVQGEHS